MKIDSRSNLIRLKRRFAETNKTFAERFANKRFAMDLNKHFDYCIGEEMTKLTGCFDYYINCQVNEKAAKSKAANINYQDLYFAEAEIVEKKIAIVNEVDINQKYLYCYYFDFEKHDSKKTS